MHHTFLSRALPRLLAAVVFASASAAASQAQPTTLAGSVDLDAPPPPAEREFRAVWLSPVSSGNGPDWPSRPGLPADSQKAELVALLDRARAIGLNAVIMHVRTAADAFYPTDRAPWTAYLSGTSGMAPQPEYDPLAFAIEEAHARGLQLHAWFNPFRAVLPNFAGKAAASHVTRTHPSWVRTYGTQTWIDPGNPAARSDVLATIFEVVERYDVDGVHIDDYFYPYRETETVRRRVRRRWVTVRRDRPFPDDATWRRYGRAQGWSDRAAWRRANVDDFVKRLYKGVKERKPAVLVGISPFGIWRSGVPAGVTGLDAYGEIYADARKWLRAGWLDYVAPQLYWPLDGTQDRFRRLDAWWRAENVRDRHVWPGLFTEREDAPRQTWSPGSITQQIEWIRATRDSGESVGHVHFRIGPMDPASYALGGRIHEQAYATPALVPASPWLAPAAPGAPTLLRDSLGLVAAPAKGAATVWWLVHRRYLDGAWQSQLVRAVPGAHVLTGEELGEAPIVWVTPIGADGREGPAVRLGDIAGH